MWVYIIYIYIHIYIHIYTYTYTYIYIFPSFPIWVKWINTPKFVSLCVLLSTWQLQLHPVIAFCYIPSASASPRPLIWLWVAMRWVLVVDCTWQLLRQVEALGVQLENFSHFSHVSQIENGLPPWPGLWHCLLNLHGCGSSPGHNGSLYLALETKKEWRHGEQETKTADHETSKPFSKLQWMEAYTRHLLSLVHARGLRA